MQGNTLRNVLVLTAVALVAISALAVIPAADADSQEQEYDEDLGVFWSYSIRFSFSGYDATSVTWDFGDGSEQVTAWSVTHGYPVTHDYTDPGVYYVTQTATNSEGDSVAVYKVTVMGYPYVEFISNGGTEVETIMMTSGGLNATAATEPAQPTRDGFTFTGWYTDRSCTQPYDWSSTVTVPVTLYAGWTEDSSEPGTEPGGEEDTGGSNDDGNGLDVLAIALIVVGIIVIIAALVSHFYPVAIIGIIVTIIGVLRFAGVF